MGVISRLLSACILAALALAPAAADDKTDFDAATKAQIQEVITKQLDAFQREDGKAAEAFAAPGIKQKFPDPLQFFAMVKEHYAALLHPRSTKFGETTPSPHGPLQKMTIVAADGTVWEAVYAFEQVAGQWRITGCGLQRDENQQDI